VAIRIQQFILESYHSNTYLISVEQEQACYLVDLGNAKDAIASLQQHQYIKAVFLTHAHYDHIADIHCVLEKFPNCSIYSSLYTKEALADSKLNLSFYHGTPVAYSGDNVVVLYENDTLDLFQNQFLTVIATPGHNEGCLSFKFQHFCFTGDALIPQVKVVTKLKSGNKVAAKLSIDKIRQRLVDTDVVLAGHGAPFSKKDLDWDCFL
jgi:hydroxyacylglutathione hydrolase